MPDFGERGSATASWQPEWKQKNKKKALFPTTSKLSAWTLQFWIYQWEQEKFSFSETLTESSRVPASVKSGTNLTRSVCSCWREYKWPKTRFPGYISPTNWVVGPIQFGVPHSSLSKFPFSQTKTDRRYPTSELQVNQLISRTAWIGECFSSVNSSLLSSFIALSILFLLITLRAFLKSVPRDSLIWFEFAPHLRIECR